jgi:hypothetical protein
VANGGGLFNLSFIVIQCCKCGNDLEVELGTRGGMKKYCDACVIKNKNDYKQKKNRYQRAKRIYPTLKRNLTKNYIIMMEGIKK